jgi:diaminopimelate epimerase
MSKQYERGVGWEQCCGSGSGRIRIICKIRISIQSRPIRIDIISKQMIKLINNTFSRKFQYAVQNNENYDTFDADEKDKT